MPSSALQEWKKSWLEEKRSSYLYEVISVAESDSTRKTLFKELSREAVKQAEIWAGKIKKSDIPLPFFFEPDLRTRIVSCLVRWFGPRPMRPILAAMKVRGMSVYSQPQRGVEGEGATRAPITRAGGNLRAAVFGVNDGLVSNASLILGVAGASADPKLILLSGIAGLLAGSLSMATGEFISVRSQREMFEYQIGLEREELKEYPNEEAEELALIYKAKGLSEGEAKELAQKLIADPEKALDTLTREELGLNPEELGSPWGAAGFSFLSFAVGALVPLVPFLMGVGTASLFFSVLFTSATLFGVGATLSLFTGRGAVRGGFRMLLIGAAAGAATFFIGKLLGVSLS